MSKMHQIYCTHQISVEQIRCISNSGIYAVSYLCTHVVWEVLYRNGRALRITLQLWHCKVSYCNHNLLDVNHYGRSYWHDNYTLFPLNRALVCHLLWVAGSILLQWSWSSSAETHKQFSALDQKADCRVRSLNCTASFCKVVCRVCCIWYVENKETLGWRSVFCN